MAFSNMAAIEVCFKKLTGSAGDYSEQQLVDCGFEQNGANGVMIRIMCVIQSLSVVIIGCNGAWTYSYLKTAADSGLGLAHESTYPYLNKEPKLTCPAGLDTYNQGAKASCDCRV